MKQRLSGLDLLRCIATLFVVIFHSFLYNGFYSEPQTGIHMLFANSVRWLSVSCIGIFIMLTGYLKSAEETNRAYFRSLIPVLSGYVLASAISIPIRHFLLGDVRTGGEWIRSFFAFGGVYYGWYVKMYIGLLLLSPVINSALKHIKSRRQILLISLCMIIVTAMPGATRLTFFPDYWRAAYPLTYYMLGAIIRRLKPKFSPWICLGAAGCISFAMGAATLISTDGNIGEAFVQEFGDIWILLISVCIFLALYRINLPDPVQTVLKYAAGGCFGGYMLSHLFDAWGYRMLPQYHTPEQYIKIFVFQTLPIYIVSLLAGALMMIPVNFVYKRLCRKLQNKALSEGGKI